jgi:hypothetical protein
VQVDKWVEKWTVLCEKKHIEDTKKASVEEAAARTYEAEQKLLEVENILLSTLEVNDAVDWEVLKNKDAFKTVAGVFGLALAIGFNIVFQRMGANSQNQDQLMLLMLQGNNSLLNTTSKFIPTVKAAANAMLYSSDIKGIINLLLFLFISLAALGILLLLGEVLYFKGVIGISEASSKRKKLSKKELDESTTQNSMLKSYIAKELCFHRAGA